METLDRQLIRRSRIFQRIHGVPRREPQHFPNFFRSCSKSRQNPISQLFHFLTYSLSDTGLVHGRRLKRLPKRHGPLIHGQHMKKTEIAPHRQSLIPEQPSPQLKGSSQVLFTYNICVKVNRYPAPRCGGSAIPESQQSTILKLCRPQLHNLNSNITRAFVEQ